MNANRWKSLSFCVSHKKHCSIVQLQVGEDEEVGGTYVSICTIWFMFMIHLRFVDSVCLQYNSGSLCWWNSSPTVENLCFPLRVLYLACWQTNLTVVGLRLGRYTLFKLTSVQFSHLVWFCWTLWNRLSPFTEVKGQHTNFIHPQFNVLWDFLFFKKLKGQQFLHWEYPLCGFQVKRSVLLYFITPYTPLV